MSTLVLWWAFLGSVAAAVAAGLCWRKEISGSTFWIVVGGAFLAWPVAAVVEFYLYWKWIRSDR